MARGANVQIIDLIEERVKNSYLLYSYLPEAVDPPEETPGEQEEEPLAYPPNHIQDEELFSKRSACLMLFMLGASYKNMLSPQRPLVGHSVEFSKRCVKAFRKSCEVAASDLSIADRKCLSMIH